MPSIREHAPAPLPRAYQWADGSAYVTHVELVRKARGAEMPPSFWTDPLMYQGGSDSFIGPTRSDLAADEAWGIDFEGEVAVDHRRCAYGCDADEAAQHIKLVMLVNDVSLRNLIPAELAKGFGFFQSKPASAFSPVAVTPDELGDGLARRPSCICRLQVDAQRRDIRRARCRHRHDVQLPAADRPCRKDARAGAGTIIGSGTVSNQRPRTAGPACIAERRMLETDRERRAHQRHS